MIFYSTPESTRLSKAAAVLKGTQLAAVAGSIFITLYLLAFRSSPTIAENYFWFGLLPFFFSLLIVSIVLVNAFVLLIGLPIYLLINRPVGRLSAALLGAVTGTVAFWAVLLGLSVLSGTRISDGEMQLARGDFWAMPVGPWCVYFIPAFYGALVGLFTSELESKRSHIA